MLPTKLPSKSMSAPGGVETASVLVSAEVAVAFFRFRLEDLAATSGCARPVGPSFVIASPSLIEYCDLVVPEHASFVVEKHGLVRFLLFVADDPVGTHGSPRVL